MSHDPPPDCREQVRGLNEEVDRLYLEGSYAAALAIAGRACKIAKRHLGKEHPDLATSLNGLAALYEALGLYARSEPLYRRALEIRRAALGTNHPLFAESLNNLAVLYHSRGEYPRAEPLYCQALAIDRHTLGEQHPNVAADLNALAVLYDAMGDPRRAEPLHCQALALRRAALGEHHPDVAASLNNLAALYAALGSYVKAEPLFRQAIALRRTALGEHHPLLAQSLHGLALLCRAQGDYARAEPFYRQVVESHRAALGETHPHFAQSLSGLAELYQAMGEFARAEPLFRQAAEILRRALGEDHPHFAQSLNGLAEFYRVLGDHAQAEPLYRRANEVWRRALGEDHPSFATGLNNLALLYVAMGDFARAEPLVRRAMEACRGALGEDHPSFAIGLNNLASLYRSVGDFALAEPLYRQAVEILRGALGEAHPFFANGLNGLATVYHLTKDFARAEPLYHEAAAIRRAVLGEDHPEYAISLNNLAALAAATGRAEAALPLMQQAAGIDDHLIGQVCSFGSDSQRTALLKQTQERLESFLSLVWGPLASSAEAVPSALDLVLRRKAIAAEVQAVQRDAVLGGKYPSLQPLLQEWSALRRQIARKMLAGPGPEGPDVHQQHLEQWHEQRERLEADLARQIPEMNLEQKLRAADRRAVALALPAGVSLVEFVRFNAFNFKAAPARGEPQWQPAHYLAFVLSADKPDKVRMLDLGEAEPLDELVELFRAGVNEPPESRNMIPRSARAPRAAEQAGQQLRAAVFDPLRTALGDCRRLLLSPDGNLTRLPFAVLPDADGRLLVDDYRISYVNCGRDVLRFGAAASGTATAALVVADPDFDLGAGAVAESPTQSRGRISRDLPRDCIHFGRLPGTRGEGAAIAALLGVVPWQDVGALEARLKRECRSPRILHLATHGFFLQDEKHDPNQERRGLGLSLDTGRLSGPLPENPLLRAGLALAGANTFLHGGTPPEEAEDGLLTAEDVSGLDLLATELVVLSACETGLGEVRTGEGVFGLQRAFTLAGAKTLVMSLWSVPDDATRELMEDFYTRILAGEGRADALRNAQLALRETYPDPYFWGAFICQGDPAPLPNVRDPPVPVNCPR